MKERTLAQDVYRDHIRFVRRMNDTHIFLQKALPRLEEIRTNLAKSTHRKDRRYYVPKIGRKVFSRRKDREVREIYDRFLEREIYENLIVTCISHFEAFLFNTLESLIIKHPKKLTISVGGVESQRTIPVEFLLDATDIENALRKTISWRLDRISHATPAEYLKYLHNISGVDTDDGSFLSYFEMKATRDIVVHNRGVVNDEYLKKSADKSRGAIGERIEIDKEYFDYCLASLKRISGIIARDIKKNFPT